MAIEVICMEDPAFYALIETVVKRIQATMPNAEPEFITRAQAMKILGYGKTRFNELQQAGEFEFVQKAEGTRSMFLTKSIRAYQQRNLKK